MYPEIEQLASLKPGFYNGDFLLTWKHSEDDLRAVLTVAEILEGLCRDNLSARVFDSGLAVSVFRDKSTRTRFSFASAANLLGLTVQDLDEGKSQVAHGETVRETANMVSFLTEVIGIRDDMFLDQGHRYMAEVAGAVAAGYGEGVLPQRPAVINLQCDQDHPTQTLSDLLHLKRTFGSLEALRGKKLVMSWAYSPSYGKPLSVAQGVVNLMTRFGMHVVLAHPPGYDIIPRHRDIAARHAAESGGRFETVHGIDEAFQDADIVYPKSWAPYTVMQRRSELLRAGQTAELDELERECLVHNARHRDWECNEQRMSRARDDALYMHCLPADISGVSCETGEVSAEVFEQFRVQTYRQAGHKPFVIAAMILLARFQQPARLLEELRRRGRRRAED